MALLEAGIPFATVAPQVQPSALAGLRPLTFGPSLQFQPLPAVQVPEAKPYIAEGITRAIESFGAGIKARYQQEREDKREAARAALEKAKMDEQIRHNKAIEQATNARINAVASGKLKEEQQAESVMGDEVDLEENDQPIQAMYTPPASSSVRTQGAALQGLPPVASAIPAAVVPPVVVFDEPSAVTTETLPSAALAAMTPQEEKSAKEQEAAFLKQQGVYGDLPLPQIEPPKVKEQPKTEELPKLGTSAGENDKSLVEAVKNPPALGILGEPLLVPEDNKPKSALSKAPAIQEVDQRDMRYRFGDRPDLANRQAMLFNKKYPYANVQAEVKEPSKSVPYWHVEYNDVSKERRAESRTIEEHAAAQGLKQQRLDISREAKVQAMANNYERHPTSKLMDTRKDAMQRMLVAIQEDKHARENNDAASLGLIHQEMMDLFAQFASGKAPTEAQFSETKHAFSGLSGWQNIAKKVQFWKSGAKLDERDVRTMQDLMLNTYNTSADQVNSQLTTIESILKSENPNISPMKMPVKYPLLKTKEFLKEKLGGKDPEEALTEYSKLRGEYFDDATNSFKKPMPQDKREQFLKLKPIVEDYIALKNNSFIPPNLNELKHPKKEVFGNLEYFKVPGFHASYFSAPPPSSLVTEGHYQGSGE